MSQLHKSNFREQFQNAFKEITPLVDKLGLLIKTEFVELGATENPQQIICELFNNLTIFQDRQAGKQTAKEDATGLILQVCDFLNFFKDIKCFKQRYQHLHELKWPIISRNSENELYDPNQTLSQFIILFQNCEKLFVSVFHQNKTILEQMVTIAEKKLQNSSYQIPINNSQIFQQVQQLSFDQKPQGYNLEEEKVQKQIKVGDYSAEQDINQYFFGQPSQIEMHEEIYGANQDYIDYENKLIQACKSKKRSQFIEIPRIYTTTMRIFWQQEFQRELLQSGLLKIMIEAQDLPQKIIQDDSWHLSVFSCKVFNKNIYEQKLADFEHKQLKYGKNPFFQMDNNEQEAIFRNSQYFLKSYQNNQFKGFQNVDKDSYLKLEQSYWEFLEMIRMYLQDTSEQQPTLTVDTVSQFFSYNNKSCLVSCERQFQTVFTIDGVLKGGVFNMKNRSTGENKILIRRQEFPGLTVSQQENKMFLKNYQNYPIDFLDRQKVIDYTNRSCRIFHQGQIRDFYAEDISLPSLVQSLIQNNPDQAAIPQRFMISTDFNTKSQPLISEYQLGKIFDHQPIVFTVEDQIGQIEQFDILSSFLNIKVPRGKNYGLQKLFCDQFEYKFIEMAIKETCRCNLNPDHSKNYKILCIEKVYNQILMEKFSSELQRDLKKYRNARVCDLVSLLFFGNQYLTPIEVYGHENFFIRKNQDGQYMDFYNNFHQVLNSAYQMKEYIVQDEYGRDKEMTAYGLYMCFVNKGETVQIPEVMPSFTPCKFTNKDQIQYIQFGDPVLDLERFDSITSNNGSMVSIQEADRYYPGYFITFTQ